MDHEINNTFTRVQHAAPSGNSEAEPAAEASSELVCAVQHVALTPGDMVARIAAGDIPRELDQLAAGAAELLAINAKTRQTISVIIATAREQLSLKEWITWCDERFGTDTAARSHMAAVGKMLLTCLEASAKLYRKLFPLDFEKLYALTPIPATQLAAVLTPMADDLPKMSRNAVRDAVAKAIGRERHPRPESPALPGFEAILDQVTDADEELFATAVQDDANADKAIRAGQRILNAAICYYHSTQDILKLHELKTYLKGDMMAELEQAIAMLATPEQ